MSDGRSGSLSAVRLNTVDFGGGRKYTSVDENDFPKQVKNGWFSDLVGIFVGILLVVVIVHTVRKRHI